VTAMKVSAVITRSKNLAPAKVIINPTNKRIIPRNGASF
jgi:hypothetical protein